MDYLNIREDLYLRQWLYRHFKRLKMLDLFTNYNLIEFRQFKKSVFPVLKQTDAFIDLKHINTRPINLAYDEKNLFIEHSFGGKTKTAGENLRPNDSSAQNEVGIRARPLETVKDRNRAFIIEGYAEIKLCQAKNPIQAKIR